MTALKSEEISILEDSRYFVNRSVEALNLQIGRLESNLIEDSDSFWIYIADAHFYIVALKRLQQAFLASKKISNVWSRFEECFETFSNEISDAIAARNILEHIDEYIKNTGRNKEIKNVTLYSYSFDESGCLIWGDIKFDRHKLQDSAERVVKKYREITSEEFKLYIEREGESV